MSIISKEENLSFDDVLLYPQHSIVPINEVDLTTRIFNTTLRLPVLSAAMDTITGYEMAKAMYEYGGAGVIHKNMPRKDQEEIMERLLSDTQLFGFAVSIGDFDAIEYGHSLSYSTFAVVDSAHADTRAMCNFVEELHKSKFDMDRIIIGNISTKEAARRLIKKGAKILKIGQGPSGICTTRIIAGIGVPQLQAIMDIYEMVQSEFSGDGIKLVADGGLRTSGDIAKALAAGADLVMLGGMLAGTNEALGGDTYRGMGSLEAMKLGSATRYGQTVTQKNTPEGVEIKVDRKGPVSEVLFHIEGGLRASMGYTGSGDLEELKESVFVKITNAGIKESHPHSYKEIKSTVNYKV